MKGKHLTAFLLFLVICVGVLIVIDKKTERTDLGSYMTTNPFDKDMASYENVPDSLISHVESKQIRLNVSTPIAIDFMDGQLYLLADDFLQVINTDGKELKKVRLGEGATCMTVLKDKRVLVGFKDYVVLLNTELQVIKQSEPVENSIFSSIGSNGKLIFVADAGQKQVLIFDFNLKQKNEFKGESGVSDQHGFIVPSAHFDLAINNESELWVVNPGMHALQNYSDQGKLRGFWGKTSFEINGFSGCCNPFYIAFLSDGSIVTSEKGLVRIKIHEPSGLLRSVVAAPSSFTGEKKAPDVTIDEKNKVYALDFEKNLIRIFTPKNEP
ncbi:MAG TPA: hypothetical protein VFP20_10125 [Bacteroidales bacterium]|nr:hypothetical protein [Bacteroidales bacterium]